METNQTKDAKISLKEALSFLKDLMERSDDSVMHANLCTLATYFEDLQKAHDEQKAELLRIAKYAQTVARDNGMPFPKWADEAIAEAEKK